MHIASDQICEQLVSLQIGKFYNSSNNCLYKDSSNLWQNTMSSFKGKGYTDIFCWTR